MDNKFPLYCQEFFLITTRYNLLITWISLAPLTNPPYIPFVISVAYKTSIVNFKNPHTQIPLPWQPFRSSFFHIKFTTYTTVKRPLEKRECTKYPRQCIVNGTHRIPHDSNSKQFNTVTFIATDTIFRTSICPLILENKAHPL